MWQFGTFCCLFLKMAYVLNGSPRRHKLTLRWLAAAKLPNSHPPPTLLRPPHPRDHPCDHPHTLKPTPQVCLSNAA
jgi:hypothetical protein